MAAGGPPPGGGGEVETLGNNLSVPTIFVPSTAGAPALRTACPTASVAASGPTATYGDVAYYLQKTTAVWSAECSTADSATVTAKWGDNLLNGMPIKAGKPIRVEMGLLTDLVGQGFTVVNLTPDLADRVSTYGTDGTVTGLTTRVWDAGARLAIRSGSGALVYEGAMSAEINSTGSVVYGYNWGVKGKSLPQPGTYQLTFSVSDATTIIAVPSGEGAVVSFGPHVATVDVVVSATTGGGGRK